MDPEPQRDHNHAQSRDTHAPINSTAQGASLIQTNQESPKWLPWLMFCAILSGFAVASSIFCFWQMVVTERRGALLDNDWMQMNAYLAVNGVVKDEHGFYVKDGKRLQESKK